MAYIDHGFGFARTGLCQHLARALETPFDRRYRQRTARIAELRSLSDGALAARGIARDDILFHVFSTR